MANISEMVTALNAAAHATPVRFLKRGNGINTQDVVLYVTAEHQLQTRMEEGDLVAHLPQGHVAYEIDEKELEQAYKKVSDAR